MTPVDVPATVESNEHLLKAVIALLSLRDPTFLRQLDRVFDLAALHDSPISDVTPTAWAEIRGELEVISQFIHGEDDSSATTVTPIKMAH